MYGMRRKAEVGQKLKQKEQKEAPSSEWLNIRVVRKQRELFH